MLTLSQLNLEKLTPSEIGELLINAKKAYYTGGKPLMDDHTYDTLEEILRQKNPHHRFFTKIGTPNFDTGFAKKSHTIPMGSLNKVTSYSELVKYFQLKNVSDTSEFVTQPKCDGLSLEIEYQQGRVIDAITRGDGQVGDVVTQNVVHMQNYKENLAIPFTGSVRCEIVVTYKDFEKLNAIASEIYSNPRNAASGISQRLDGKYSEYCTLMAVDIAGSEVNFTTEMDQVNYLKKLGIKTVDTFLCKSLSDVEDIFQKFSKESRGDYSFEIDGLVVKINDQKTQKELGRKDNRPKGQAAYKFPSRTDETRLLGVVWQTGPYGLVTPVAQVEPVEISGAVITFASLSNYQLVKEMNLNIGDIVEISRRGDVIPHVEKVITKVTSGVLEAPVNCPVCNTRLVIDNKYLRCPNSIGCPAQMLGTLRLFCATLDIKGISSKTIEKLSAAGKVKLPGDFYNLKVDDFLDLDGLGEKSGQNIVSEIQAKRKLTLVQAFDAAAIPNFSAARIRQVIDAGFDTADKIKNLEITDLEPLTGFQITLATKIVAGIRQRLDSINSILNKIEIINQKSTGILEGKTFAITGELTVPRREIEERITQNGGKIVSSVSKNTSYLLTNETDSDSSKFVAAKKLGIPIISQDGLDQLL